MGSVEKPSQEELEARRYDLCVIDADILAYRAACASEKTEYELFDKDNKLIQRFESAKSCKIHIEDCRDIFDEDTSGWVRKSVVVDKGVSLAKSALDSLIKTIKKNINAGEYRFYLTGKDNFRDDVATIKEYKGNRKGTSKPKYLQEAREYLQSKYKARMIHGREADDAVSVSLYKGFTDKGFQCKTILASIDKDLKCSPGVHYSITKESFEFITEDEANKWMFTQIIAGDPTDNIGGIPDVSAEFREKYGIRKGKGVAIKTAEKILEDLVEIPEMYERTLEAYSDYYGRMAVYKNWRGNNVHKSVVEIIDEIAELVFMERIKGERWVEFKKRVIG